MRFPSRSRTVLLIADHVPAPTARGGSKDVRGAPGQCRARGHFGSLSWWHPSARTCRALPGVASGRSHPPYPGATSPILPKIRKVRRSHPSGYVIRLPIYSGGPPFPYSVDASDLHQKTSESTTPYPTAMPFTSHRSFGSMHPGGPPYPGAAHARQQLPHTSTSQCGSSHTFAPFLHTIRRLPHLPTPRRNPPYKCQYTVQSVRLLGFFRNKNCENPPKIEQSTETITL